MKAAMRFTRGKRTSSDGMSRSALVLVAGRSVGYVAAFAIPVVLARLFDVEEFGAYKFLFLVFGTFYGVAQLGMAESLYYFLPKHARESGRHIGNSVIVLALAGVACIAVLGGLQHQVAGWFGKPQISGHLLMLGVLLALTLATTVFEIVMIARKQHVRAALTYAASDLARTLLFIIPAIGFRSVAGVLAGAVMFASLRLVAMLFYLGREFGTSLRPDYQLLRSQLAYALPFALAVGIEVIQLNLHQYIVAARFDAATFAFYAVGCLQVPLVDLIMTSAVNVMMVKMAEDTSAGHRKAAVALWHETVWRLALVFFPLTALLLVTGHQVIVALYTARYAASVPIFMVWTLMIIPVVFAVDGVLRVYAQTRFLLVMNVVRLGLVAGLVIPFLNWFGLSGAVLVTLLATLVVKAMGVMRIAHILHVRVGDVLPWPRLLNVATRAAVAVLPAFWITRSLALPPLAVLVIATAAYGITYAALIWPSIRIVGRGSWVVDRASGVTRDALTTHDPRSTTHEVPTEA
jgi:O-antigen/teichoic acid export membrane protein